jgi:hypothetical protein
MTNAGSQLSIVLNIGIQKKENRKPISIPSDPLIQGPCKRAPENIPTNDKDQQTDGFPHHSAPTTSLFAIDIANH